MADKTTTLTTQTGDSIYPNVLDENIPDTIARVSDVNKLKTDVETAYLTKANAEATYQTKAGMVDYVSKTYGDGTYATITQLGGKQDKLTAGSNITIEGATIAAVRPENVALYGDLAATDEDFPGGTGGGGGATGGGGSTDINVLQVNDEEQTYSGTLDINKLNVFKGSYFNAPAVVIMDHGTYAYYITYYIQGNNGLNLVFNGGGDGRVGEETYAIQLLIYSHFITMTNSTDNVALYFTIQNTTENTLTPDTITSYLAGKKVLVNGNLHGVVPTYISGESGKIKIYYMTPGDNNINPTPDEYQDLSSFTISDLVSAIVPPVE